MTREYEQAGTMIRWSEDAMGPNAILPLLVTAVIVMLVVSVVAAIALRWNTEPRVRLIVRRTWSVLVIFSVLAVAIFWIASALTGTERATVDRSLQQKQHEDLQQRLKKGGH